MHVRAYKCVIMAGKSPGGFVGSKIVRFYVQDTDSQFSSRKSSYKTL